MSRENQERQQASRKEKTVIRISSTSLASILFIGVAAIVLAYIGGVMSGRQSCPVPERQIAESVPLPGQTDSSDGGRGILAASELEFARALRGENNRVDRISPQPEEKKIDAAPAKEAEKPAEKNAPPRKTPQPQQAQAQPAQPAEDLDSGAIYDHVFQVGAFRDENSVDRLREKLEGHGLRTSMRKEGKVYVVLVRLRGTPARAAEVVGLARSLGLGEPVRRSRQPARD